MTLDELKVEPLVLMQEGAGVRQVIDDELREAGVRLRDLDVQLELGLQESARSAVLAGYGVTFISRSAIEADVAAGTRRRRARRRARAVARDLARALGGPRRDARRAGVRRVRASAARVIVRWGLDALPEVCAEAGVDAPLLVASPRWDRSTAGRAGRALERGAVGAHRRGGGARAAAASSPSAAAARSISARRSPRRPSVPLVSVPTTYAGAEWTTYYGVRDPERQDARRRRAARDPRGIVYDVELTLDLPRETTVGTAMNALAHCAEALYVDGHNEEADEHALAGARLIGEWLPRVVDAPHDREARTELLRGACHGGAALGGSGLALAPRDGAGGRRPLRPPARDAERRSACRRRCAGTSSGRPRRCARFREAVGGVASVEELAALGGVTRLRELGVPEADLPELAEAAAGRAGNRANPRPATAAEIEELLRSVW